MTDDLSQTFLIIGLIVFFGFSMFTIGSYAGKTRMYNLYNFLSKKDNTFSFIVDERLEKDFSP